MKAQRRLLKAGTVLGVLLLLLSGFMLLGSLHGVQQAFATLRVSGIGDPRGLAGSVAEILASTAGSLAPLAAGSAILLVSMNLARRLRASSQPPPLPHFAP